MEFTTIAFLEHVSQLAKRLLGQIESCGRSTTNGQRNSRDRWFGSYKTNVNHRGSNSRCRSEHCLPQCLAATTVDGKKIRRAQEAYEGSTPSAGNTFCSGTYRPAPSLVRWFGVEARDAHKFQITPSLVKTPAGIKLVQREVERVLIQNLSHR